MEHIAGVRRQHRMGYPKEFMIGYQVEVTGFKTKNRMLEMFTGDDIAPGFFAWAIPNGDTHRIGMWSRAEDLDGRSCEELLNNLMTKSRWAYKFEDCKEIGRFCGPIPTGSSSKTSTRSSITDWRCSRFSKTNYRRRNWTWNGSS